MLAEGGLSRKRSPNFLVSRKNPRGVVPAQQNTTAGQRFHQATCERVARVAASSEDRRDDRAIVRDRVFYVRTA